MLACKLFIIPLGEIGENCYTPNFLKRNAYMLIRIFLSVLIVLLLSGCEKKPKEYRPTKQELRINIKCEPLSLDPRKPNDATSLNFLKMCFDGLLRLGLDGKPYPSIAERIEL